MPNLRTAGMFLLIALVGVLLATNFACADENISAPRALEGWRLPDVEGQWVDFSPQQAPGHRLLLFWATWCPYCKALMPHLERFRRNNADRDIEFYALNIWEDSDPKAYVAKMDFNFRLILDADNVAKRYGIKGTPGVLLVNQDNEVVYERRSGSPPEQVITDLEFIVSNRKKP